MSKLGIILADFTTALSTAIIVGGTTASLQNAIDDDGNALPTGRYFFSLDGDNSNKEHISCTLTGTALTNIKSLSRQGVETTGVARAHRIGCTVTLTDFAHIKFINDILLGTTALDATTPLTYDGTASITAPNQLATKAYVDSVAISGAPDASTSTKGITKLSVAAVSPTAPIAVGDNDYRIVGYFIDTGAADAYAITPSPSIGAYAAGQKFSFIATHANTTSSTLNVNGLGVKTIKKFNGSTNLVAGDIALNQIVFVEYDGTNFQMLSPSGISIVVSGAAQGDVIYYNGTAWARLSAGTAGQFLKTNGAGQNVSWASAYSTMVRGTDTFSGPTPVNTTHTITHALGKRPAVIMVNGSFDALPPAGSGTILKTVFGEIMLDTNGNPIGGIVVQVNLASGAVSSVSVLPRDFAAAASTSGGSGSSSITVNNITDTTFDIVYTGTMTFGSGTELFGTITWAVWG